MKHVLSALVVVLASITCAYSQSENRPVTVIQQEGLAKKLIEGSPWRFETKYENTVHNFRFSPEGKFQRLSPRNQVWSDFSIGENQTGSYSTTNGHTITYSLDESGNPKATHSKHVASFKSIK